MNGFAAYKMPDAVKITLPGTDEHFLVDLPTSWNRKYQREWQSILNQSGKLEADGFVMKDINVVDLQVKQITSFIECCVVSMPSGMDARDLLSDYWPAAAALFEIASKLADEKEAEAKSAVGKPLPTSVGKPNGKGKQTFIPSSTSKERSLSLT